VFPCPALAFGEWSAGAGASASTLAFPNISSQAAACDRLVHLVDAQRRRTAYRGRWTDAPPAPGSGSTGQAGRSGELDIERYQIEFTLPAAAAYSLTCAIHCTERSNSKSRANAHLRYTLYTPQ
jgi:hypothetical protein